MLPKLRDDLSCERMRGWTLSYLHSTGKEGDFPIGNIVDPETPADKAREVIEQTLGYEFGPIVHVSLGHKEHNKVVTLDGMPTTHTVVNCDAVIFPKAWRLGVETLLGDCTCNIIIGPEYIGFMHAGRPELFGGLIQQFAEIWPDYREDSAVFIGPGICGQHYELLDQSSLTGTGLEFFNCRTVWNTQGYDVNSAIRWMFHGSGFSDTYQLIESEHQSCPFCMRLEGHDEWASDQYCRARKLDANQPYSRRDCAFLHQNG